MFTDYYGELFCLLLLKKVSAEFLAELQEKSNKQRAKTIEQQTKSNEQRGKSNERRATSKKEQAASNEQK